MASEHAHKIAGAVRKLRAVMEAFDMKGTNRATMLNAINTINALNTRPAPAAIDAGLGCQTCNGTGNEGRGLICRDCDETPSSTGLVRYRLDDRPNHDYDGNAYSDPIMAPHQQGEYVLRSQAEELLAAERAEKDHFANLAEQRFEEIRSLKADNAAQAARIKELEQALETEKNLSRGDWACQRDVDQMSIKVEALEAKLAAAEKTLEPFARLEIPSKPQGNAGAYSIRHKDILEARAVLGGKPS